MRKGISAERFEIPFAGGGNARSVTAFCWCAACRAVGGTIPAPAFLGETEKGTKSSLPHGELPIMGPGSAFGPQLARIRGCPLIVGVAFLLNVVGI
jgi:hypothetical protein